MSVDRDAARAALNEQAWAYVERLEDEHATMKRRVREMEVAAEEVETVRQQLLDQLASVRFVKGADAAKLVEELSREVSRSVDLKRAVDSALVNLEAPGTMGVPQSNVAAARRNLQDGREAWKRAK